MNGFQIWDSHVHIFPPEIYEHWETYAARDPYFGMLTKKSENGTGTEEAWANAEEALHCAELAGVYGLVMQGWYWNDIELMYLHNDYMAQAIKNHPQRLKAFASINPMFGKDAIAEIERCVSLGFCGIGELGPGANGFDFQSPQFLDVLECAVHYHLPVCIHCGEPIGHTYPGKDTTSFCTEDASGSTSQAANVIEGIEAGTSLFLIDEDTSATNFMIRDELMQRVIHREMEPITPFIERIRELYENYGISTVIVAGSSGAYFHIADSIIQMDRYVPKDITVLAKKEAENFPQISVPEQLAKKPAYDRVPRPDQAFHGNDRIKMKTMGKESVMINRDTIDLRYLEQITDSEQVAALGYCVRYAQKHLIDGKKNLIQIVDELEEVMQNKSLAALCESTSSVSCMAVPRRQEIFACLDRYRALRLG